MNNSEIASELKSIYDRLCKRIGHPTEELEELADLIWELE